MPITSVAAEEINRKCFFSNILQSVNGFVLYYSSKFSKLTEFSNVDAACINITKFIEFDGVIRKIRD